MKPIDIGDNNKRVYFDEHNEKEYLNLKIYLLKGILLIGVVKYLLLIK